VQDQAPRYQLIVNFACAQDVIDFAELLGQKVTPSEAGRQLQSLWHPQQDIGRMVNKRYIAEERREHDSKMAGVYSDQGAQRHTVNDPDVR
jgi:hypothetical protein